MRHRGSLQRLAVVAGLAVALFVRGAGAAPSDLDEAARDAARRLGYDGIAAFKSGDFAGASEKLERAFSDLPAPTLGLWSARAYEKRGQLVRASERYLDVLRVSIPSADAEIQAQAKDTAARERAALAPRIPQLTVIVRAPPNTRPAARLDGNAVKPELIGVTFGVDPGDHDLSIEGGVPAHRAFHMAEGEARVLDFEIPKDVAEAARELAVYQRALADRRTRLRGALGLAIGGAVGVGVGAAFGVAATSAASDAKAACPDNPICPNDVAHDKTASGRTYASVSNIAFGVASGALAGATVLWISAPNPSKPNVGLRVNPAGGAALLSF